MKACDILLETAGPDRACGYVRSIGREGEEYHTCTLAELRETEVDMFTTVFIGNSQSRIMDGRLITPRGYKLCNRLFSRVQLKGERSLRS